MAYPWMACVASFGFLSVSGDALLGEIGGAGIIGCGANLGAATNFAWISFANMGSSHPWSSQRTPCSSASWVMRSLRS